MASKRALLTIISHMISERLSQGLEPLSSSIAHFLGSFLCVCSFLSINGFMLVILLWEL